MKTIFVVDDNSANLMMAEEVLSDQYEVITISSAVTMFELLEDVIPDLILLDIMMPDIDGFEALKKLKANSKYVDIPVMFLTGKSDGATEARGFELGVMDFITKPFFGAVLINRIKKHLAIETLIQERTQLLRSRTDKLLRLQNSMTSVLANMVENRDKLTGTHIQRTASYMKLLISALLKKGVYYDELIGWNTDIVISSSRLHDLGKIAVTDTILNKPGKLTPEEFDVIKTHTIEGENIINDIINESGDEEFLRCALLCAGNHHERWDGTGYPRGLKGEEIPLHGRIMALADVYDALVSERPYKPAFSHERAVVIIKENDGTHFDPNIVEVFLEISGDFANLI
ncbi:MAG: response regulator [Defluviitaleaceae bacterium]|nr:response regulator [Defluviitaleaceae bacterium]